VKEYTHEIEIIALVQACKWVVAYISALAIIYLTVFMPSKYITLTNLNSSGKKLWVN